MSESSESAPKSGTKRKSESSQPRSREQRLSFLQKIRDKVVRRERTSLDNTHPDRVREAHVSDEGVNIETPESLPQTAIEIPEKISSDWLDRVLEVGVVEKGDKSFFIKMFPENTIDKTWLTDTYGLPIPGKDGSGYFYHGTNAEVLPQIAENGIFGIPNHPTMSGEINEEVRSTAKYRRSRIGKGLVAVWKAPWSEVDIPSDSWPEPMGWPSSQYSGDKTSLAIPQHLKDAPDLRQMSPDNLIGFYVVDQGEAS
jgi:hypothetical protein